MTGTFIIKKRGKFGYRETGEIHREEGLVLE